MHCPEGVEKGGGTVFFFSKSISGYRVGRNKSISMAFFCFLYLIPFFLFLPTKLKIKRVDAWRSFFFLFSSSLPASSCSSGHADSVYPWLLSCFFFFIPFFLEPRPSTSFA